MVEGEFPKRLQLPRILERPRALAVFQLEATHGESGGEIEAFDSPTNEADTRGHRGGETNTKATLGLREVKRQPPQPLDEIATVIQSLTYGEMIELSEAMWKNRPNGSAVRWRICRNCSIAGQHLTQPQPATAHPRCSRAEVTFCDAATPS